MRLSTLIPSALRAALCLGAVSLSACFTEPKDKTAGVDDFPNSIYARVDGFLDEGKKAEGLSVAANTDSLLIRQSFNSPPAKKVAAAFDPSPAAQALPPLAKRSAAGPAADSCPMTFTLSEKKPPIGSRVTVDTLIMCVDALFLDSIKGNEHIVRGKSVTRDTVTGRVETGEFADGDGDGFLNPIPGGAAKARVQFTVIDMGVTEKTTLVIGDGPDDDFDTEPDNLIYEMSWSRTRGADTLGSAAFQDADSDGVAIDNGKPSLVDLRWFNVGPTDDDPTAKWSRIRMRTMAVYGKKGSDPRRFAIESEAGNGRLNSAVILNLKGGEDFDARDTVIARFRAVGTAPTDSVDTLETEIRIKVGDFDDKRDDTTYAIRARAKKKLGEETLAMFDFQSDRPIPHGKEPQVGRLTMRVEYSDATALDVTGRITEATVDLTATLRDGKRIHVVWDRSGKGISLEHLN